MGLRAKVERKKGGKPREEKVKGKKVVAESKEDFLKTVEGLKKEFEGIMVLSGDIDGDIFNASFIIRKGDVVGATCEYLGTPIQGDDAMKAIENKLAGSKGGMELFQFDEGDIDLAVEQNKNAILEKPLSLSSTGLKVKYLMDKWVASKKDSREGVNILNIPQISGGRKRFNLLELAKTQDPFKRKTGTVYDKLVESKESGGAGFTNLMAGLGAKSSMEDMERLKKKRARDLESEQRIGKIKTKSAEKSKKTVVGGEKVHTPIDRLLELVRKRKKIKIDERLAKTLGVKRSQIEEWAIILEDHNLVELHYSAIGDSEIRALE
ncbi:MAG: hypothetical protein B6U72_00040 [Candidatus Altiarchaeales archaeon ex4484_2]|nr:MAG: hypothetical protein B6U72_00040 [Candidatus Altiarchaeales archaeon ex4484_2]